MVFLEDDVLQIAFEHVNRNATLPKKLHAFSRYSRIVILNTNINFLDPGANDRMGWGPGALSWWCDDCGGQLLGLAVLTFPGWKLGAIGFSPFAGDSFDFLGWDDETGPDRVPAKIVKEDGLLERRKDALRSTVVQGFLL